MKFYHKGQTWDTDKYVYVAGYQLLKSWSPANRDRHQDMLLKIDGYGLSCKRAYISGVYFDFNDGMSFVKDFDICIKMRTGIIEELKFSSLEIVDKSVVAIKEKLFERMNAKKDL